MKTIAFFNNKGGVGKTSLVYHLGWMFAEHGVSTLAVDLDPQSNLTAMFLEEDRLEALWEDGTGGTVFECLKPLIARTGDLAPTPVERATPHLALIPGDLALSRFEDLLSENWPKCLDGQEAAFRVMTAFHRAIADGARKADAELVLIDVGPNLGAINRAAMIAAQQVVLPLAPDLFSLQGLKNLGPTLRDWRRDWGKRLAELPASANIDAPEGRMAPAGYIVMQHGVRESRPVKAYQRWMDRIPAVYREAVLADSPEGAPSVLDDPHSVALLKHYRSLMPLAMDARKPMFYLKAADGAIGAHTDAVRSCYDDFLRLAQRIAAGAGIELS
jgi:cellulose biosynthesis protein BcsQ